MQLHAERCCNRPLQVRIVLVAELECTLPAALWQPRTPGVAYLRPCLRLVPTFTDGSFDCVTRPSLVLFLRLELVELALVAAVVRLLRRHFQARMLLCARLVRACVLRRERALCAHPLTTASVALARRASFVLDFAFLFWIPHRPTACYFL